MKAWKRIHITKKRAACGVLGLLLLAAAYMGVPRAAEKVFAVAEGERRLPIYCVQTEKPQVSVSFDAAWGADDTDELLRILKENDVKATFFLCGYWVEKYPEEVKKIAAEGHDLGNHSATHPHMSRISSEEIAQELQKCHENVKKLTGVEMELFRPPFGEYDNHVIETAEQNGYYTIQWDVDTPTTKRKAVRILEKSRFVTAVFYIKANGKPILREINSANERACKLPFLFNIHLFPIGSGKGRNLIDIIFGNSFVVAVQEQLLFVMQGFNPLVDILRGNVADAFQRENQIFDFGINFGNSALKFLCSGIRILPMNEVIGGGMLNQACLHLCLNLPYPMGLLCGTGLMQIFPRTAEIRHLSILCFAETDGKSIARSELHFTKPVSHECLPLYVFLICLLRDNFC